MDSECCMRFFGVEVDRNFEILKFQKKFQIGKMRKHLLTFSKCSFQVVKLCKGVQSYRNVENMS